MDRRDLPVAVLGGTFDPVHRAHLALARLALEKLPARKLLWVPTGTPPYRTPPVAGAADRLAMLRLALGGDPRFAIDPRELAPGASGYTYDTLCALKAEDPASDFVLVIGGDQYAKRRSWHRWDDLARAFRVAVAERPGDAAPGDDALHLPMAPQDLSSSDIRARLGRGEDVAGLVPAPVLDYIRQKGLYR